MLWIRLNARKPRVAARAAVLGVGLLALPMLGEPRGVAAQAGAPGPVAGSDATAPLSPESERPVDELPEDDLVVTGTRSPRRLADVPVATEVISRQEMARLGAENAADALQAHAGVEVVQTLGSAAVRLQGLDSKYVLVLVDGQRVAGRLDGAVDLRRFGAEDIERIEIVRGASSALYGSDAIGGVVNIITRRTSAPLQADLHARYGSRNELDLSASAGGRLNPASARISGGFHRADAYDLDPSNVATSGGTFDEAQGGLDFELQPKSALSVRGDASYRARTQRSIDAGAGAAVLDREQRNQELRLTLAPRIDLNASDSLTISGYYTQVTDHLWLDQRGSNALDQRERNRDRLLQVTAQLDAKLGRSHDLTVGLEGSREWLESPRIDGGRAARHRLGIYAQDEWRLSEVPALIVVPGARIDIDSQFGTYPSPKLTVRVDPIDTLVVRASYGLGFRAPDFKEQFLLFQNLGVGYVIEGNPALEPETSRGLNLGAEYEALSWLWLGVELSRTDLSNMIAPQSDGTINAMGSQRYRYVNIDRAHTQELHARARLRSEVGLSVELEYVLAEARDETLQRALEGRATHRASLDADYQLRSIGLQASAGMLLVGEQPFYRDLDGDRSDETRYAEPYVTLRVRLSQDFGRSITLFVGAENLLDAGDAEFLPLPPRTFYGGLTARL